MKRAFNKYLKTIVLGGFTAALAVSCIQSPIEQTAESITKQSLMEPIEVLASDEFKGRATGTEGEEKTVNYLVGKFEEYGLQGGAEDGSFVQDVPLIGQKTA